MSPRPARCGGQVPRGLVASLHDLLTPRSRRATARRLPHWEVKFAVDDGAGDVMDAGAVFAGVCAQKPERLVNIDLVLGGEHTLGLFNDDSRAQGLLQLFCGALVLLCRFDACTR